MMRLALEDRVATFRCGPGLELRLNQLADATGYSRSRVIRKLINGADARWSRKTQSKASSPP
jgi:predicted transcriptional regulator